MVQKCCISSCGISVRTINAKGLSYHSFPTKESQRDKWLQVILPHVDKPEQFRIVQGYTRICSRHFKKKDYSIDSKKRARLSSKAVPSVFPGKDGKEQLHPVKSEQAVRIEPILIEDSGKDKMPTGTKLHLASRYSFELGDVNFTVSEDETASSAFSSQEETPTPSITPSSTGKIRKRRKTRPSQPLEINYKKRSSNPEDINIEVVGDAFADINLSHQFKSPLPPQMDSPSKKPPQFDCLLKNHAITSNLISTSLPIKVDTESRTAQFISSEEEDIAKSLDLVSFSRENILLDSNLLPSVKPVPLTNTSQNTTSASSESSLNTNVISNSESSPNDVNQFTNEPSLTSTLLSSSTPPSELVSDFLSTVDTFGVTDPLNDIYADLVSGGASLSLEDSSSVTIFDGQLLIDALQGVAEELGENGSNIDLNFNGFSRNLLNDAQVPNIISFSSESGAIPKSKSSIGLNKADSYDVTDSLIQSNSRSSPIQIKPIEITNGSSRVVSGDEENPDVNEKAEASQSSCEGSGSGSFSVVSSPARRYKVNSCKSRSVSPIVLNPKKERCLSSFSIERFRESDKDIEYYTGFPTYSSFESFYHQVEAYATNLKVTDMMAAITSLNFTNSKSSSLNDSCFGTNDSISTVNELDESSKLKRPNKNRSLMSRIDELFMTIIRLRRKIPEKVLGHMFCISQPTVSRIIRAWTIFLAKLVEIKVTIPLSSENSTSENTLNEHSTSNNCSKSIKTDKSIVRSNEKYLIQVPATFRSLFKSEFVNSIIQVGHFTTNRKTTASPFPSTTKSKRPKKEKVIVIVSQVNNESMDKKSVQADGEKLSSDREHEAKEHNESNSNSIGIINSSAIIVSNS